ncbi:hypothetical protein PLESTB_001491400 [Pleodorina starrii]|uniref:enoyl-[acyl-carrier-protein] reductase n=1 Tax=Pleodorina starrii TaxID=330485 RepID=A0A9W6F8A4_9CHLO|nr:hypothetical protein PLESTM_001453000 [Pleodorina starrii]GLC59475.1 hypothetical protein PLESTB_001491400 [Pleodorina starrii]GLC66324.1 hypothetical protein PLESTF_000411600 [Pleodorina starrii]
MLCPLRQASLRAAFARQSYQQQHHHHHHHQARLVLTLAADRLAAATAPLPSAHHHHLANAPAPLRPTSAPGSPLRAMASASSGGGAAAAAPKPPRALVHDKPGEPLDALELRNLPLLRECGPGEIQLRFLQSPINPSDVNTVQGKYPIQPQLPGAVPGHEGVAEVVAVGSEVSRLSPGDWVVPLAPAQGTWRSAGTFAAADWHRVPRDIGLEAAATLVINPPTALAMLENFVELQPGDTVAQNGATSAVGEAVIQIARAKGLRTVNLVRNRPDLAATVSRLKALGADLVTTEERLKDDLKASGLPAPLLGLNCVGGSAAQAVTRILQDGGTLVTYGGMSMQPVTASTAAMIFKDISFRGFWLTGRWSKAQGPAGRAAAMDRIVDMYRAGALQPPAVRTFALGRWREAFAALAAPHRGHKVALAPSAEEEEDEGRG